MVHRDIKPENVLLEDSNDFTKVKLVDFGSAARTDVEENKNGISGLVGTPYYVAPEVIRSLTEPSVTYGEKVDVWSVGVLTYVLLTGFPPFDAESDEVNNDKEIMDAVIQGEYDITDEELFGDIS